MQTKHRIFQSTNMHVLYFSRQNFKKNLTLDTLLPLRSGCTIHA